MDVLNTYGGDNSVLLVILTVICGSLAIAFISSAIDGRKVEYVFVGIIFVLLALLFGINAHEPVRHEVTLRPGYVIDATKYEIVEQRGDIYVIEEREVRE